MKRLLTAFCLLSLIQSLCYASGIYGTPAPYTGLRSAADNQLLAGGSYISEPLSISWSVTYDMNGTWDYTYTFTGFSGPGISNVIFNLPDQALFPLPDFRSVENIAINGSSSGINQEWGIWQGDNFGSFYSLDGTMIAFSPSTGSLVITFDSDRVPVDGDLYVNWDSANFAQNLGLGHEAGDDPIFFIATPGLIPEPSSLALLTIGSLACLVLAIRRQPIGAL